MPATSQQQQKLFGLALSVKRGETSRGEVSDEVLNIVDTMSEKKIKDFAETSHKGLPTKVETVVRNLVRETFRERVVDSINESNTVYTDWDEYVNPDYILVTLKGGKKLKIAKKSIKGGSRIYQAILAAFNDNNYKITNKIVNSMIDSLNESTRRSKDFFEDSKYGVAIHKLLKGKWDGKKVETFLDKLGDGNDVRHARILDFIAGSLGMNIRKYKTLGELMPELVKTIEQLYKLHNESINEEQEQLDEKLITFSNRAPYGQVVFIAGGAGSGKGFAVKNFLDSAGFKVRDVDEMKKQLQRLNALGKLSIQQIVDRYGKNIKPKDLEIIDRVRDAGFDLKTMDLKNPDHVYSLHILVKAMGIKDQSLANMLGAAKNPEVLPNIMFDITAKEIGDITNVIPDLMAAGYKPNNIHLVWILTNYEMAIEQNKGRDRVVPTDILLKTHIGAGNTIWGLVTKALPKGMNGRVDVVLNNQENTVYYIRRTIDKKTGKRDKAVVSGFLALPVKKQGGGILSEKVWRDILFKWIKDNGPKELTDNM
jgi:DNA-binding transcriptional MerR regulator